MLQYCNMPQTQSLDDRIQRATDQRIYILEKKVERQLVRFVTMGNSCKTYNVSIKRTGACSCTCPDYRFHGMRTGQPCKHILYVVVRVLRCEPSTMFNVEESKDLFVLARRSHAPLPVVFDVPVESDLPERTPVFDPSQSCPICYDCMDLESEELHVCRRCTKFFHQQCVNKWLKVRNTCPMCRAAIC